MADSSSKIGFRQFPPALKFVVVWMGIQSLYGIIAFVLEMKSFGSNLLLETEHNLNISALISAIVNFSLVKGMVNRENRARIWAIALRGASLLIVSILFGWLTFIASRATAPSFGLDVYALDIPLSQPQFTELFILFFAFNAILLYILLRPSTKALFTHPPAPIPAPQEPA